MRVLVVAPSWATTPPEGHGPGEQHAADLASSLLARGVSVTVFATGDSKPPCELAWHFATAGTEPAGERERAHVEAALRFADIAGFDIVHSNESNIGLLLIGSIATPSVTRMNWPGSDQLRSQYLRLPAQQRARTVVSAVSHSLASAIDFLSPMAVIPNGIDVDSYPRGGSREGPLLHLGRICPEKGSDLAVSIAEAAGREILLAGPVTDREFFNTKVLPHLKPGAATYLGPVDAAAKRDLYARASALLMPYRWPEPFGYVLVEAMACGLPCLVANRGAASEVVVSGRTGFVFDRFEDAVKAVQRADLIDAAECIEHVRRNFSVDTMADRYLDLYRSILSGA